MHLFQLLDADLGVVLRGAQLVVAEELLDEPDIRPAFEHQGGAGVAQQVARAALADVGGIDVVADELGEVVGSRFFFTPPSLLDAAPAAGATITAASSIKAASRSAEVWQRSLRSRNPRQTLPRYQTCKLSHAGLNAPNRESADWQSGTFRG